MLAASVVIPTFQRELQLRRTLAALDRQSVRGSFEIIVVDDGSVPDTRRMLSDLSLTVPLRMHWHPHAGFRAAKARNTGVLFAQGELVIFVDDDMLVPPDFVASHLEFHENHDECVAIGYRRRVPYDVWSRQEEEDADALATEATPDTRIAGMADGTWAEIPWAFFNTCHGSVRRRALFDAGLFDETFVGWGFEDTELAYRLSQIGMSFAVLDEPVPLHLEAKDADVSRAGPYQMPQHKLREFLVNSVRFSGKYPDDALVQELLSRANHARLLASRGAPPMNQDADAAYQGSAADEPFVIPSHLSLLTAYEEGDEDLPPAPHINLTGTSLMEELEADLGVRRASARRTLRTPTWLQTALMTPIVGLLAIGLLAGMVISGRYRRIFRRRRP